ncbi:hypothetical protein VTO42DRAFT_8069 [Malbranchea cinnamomea]
MPAVANIAWQRLLRIAVVVTAISLVLFYLSQLYYSGPQQPAWKQSTHGGSGYKDQNITAQPDQSPPRSSPQPYLPGTIPGIPGKVWQTARDTNLTDEQRGWIGSWLEKNPSFRYELLTDDSSDTYVYERYNQTRPDIVSLYTSLPIAILRADLLRYLILLADGGIWSDLDVTCEKEVAGWLPAEFYGANSTAKVSLVVGLEFDMEWPGEGSGIASQLSNWVFAAAPGSRHLQHVVDEVVKGLYDIAKENNVRPENITLEMISDVVDVTGPKKMTIGIVESLSQMLNRPVDDRHIARGKEPRLIGDVVVLPGNAFAAAQNGFPNDQGDKLVTHHYAGSWKGPADAARESRREKLEEERRKKEEEERRKKEEREKAQS